MPTVRNIDEPVRLRSDSGDAVVTAMLLIGVLVLVAISLYIGVRSLADRESDEVTVSSEEAPAPEPEPEPAEPVNWTPLVIGGGALLGVGALGAGGFITYKGVSAGKRVRREKRELSEQQEARKRENIRSWDNLRDSYQSVVSRYAEYETDIWKALKYPALHNVDVEETSTFLKHLKKVNNSLKEQENDDKGTIGGTDELYERLSSEVHQLDHLFDIAETNALKMEWKRLPIGEKKELTQAIRLLTHAENEGNSPAARQTYYEQLQKVVDRLNSRHAHNVIPDATINLLATGKERLMLTDGIGDSETVRNTATEEELVPSQDII